VGGRTAGCSQKGREVWPPARGGPASGRSPGAARVHLCYSFLFRGDVLVRHILILCDGDVFDSVM
jgi:hypothetical protein